MSKGRRYYEEELNYLIEAGREYARLHPERARLLNLSDPRSRDPHVERLVEAFAFLTGSVRQRLDDDFPQLTHALLDLVWPHYLRPVPPMALVRFLPVEGMVRERQRIPKGYLVDSRPTSSDVACRFRTSYPVDIYPFRLQRAGLHTADDGQRSVRLQLALEPRCDPASVSVDRLRLHISAEPSVAYELYRVLRTQLAEVVLRLGRDRRRVLPSSAVEPVGFRQDEEILPYSKVSFPGYRLLTEYFSFPEKFLFVDLVGLGTLDLEDEDARSFEVDLVLSGVPPEGFRPTEENLLLFVTPVVNLFERDGEPIRIDQLRSEYRVLGDYTHPDAYEVIAVNNVQSSGRNEGSRVRFAPFYSFEHGGDSVAVGDETPYEQDVFYHTRHRFTPAGNWATYLSLVSARTGELPPRRTLSLELECMNGRLCREVGLEDICVPGGEQLDFVTFRNITRPTDVVYPKLGDGAEWRFISHMALNFLSVSDPGAMRTILSLYNTGERPANQRRIESIIGVHHEPRERLIQGAPVRGTRVMLTLDERNFDDLGDLLIFVQVLNEFLSLHASINAYTELIVRREPSGEELECPAVSGKLSVI
jgi:type VI secretion system protein ImpG